MKKSNVKMNKTVAVDVGTTTICAALLEVPEDAIESGAAEGDGGVWQVTKTAARPNSQSLYGKDVMSRLKVALKNSDKLQLAIRADIAWLFKELCGDEKPSKLVITGNTAMTHLFMDWDVSGMLMAPYEAFTLDSHMEDLGGIETVILPGISPFVGADILTGLGFIESTGTALGEGTKEPGGTYAILDIGTNGEMAVFNGEEYFVTSTAAGPALEGAGISAGMAACDGAISKVELAGNIAKITTIGDLPRPKGICGSGVISIVSELYRNGIIDSTGTLMEEYFDEGYPVADEIYFTQDDVRNVQYAKAAIRGGLELLLAASDAAPGMAPGRLLAGGGAVGRLYLAGSFGEHIDIEAAARIGLIPPELKSRTIPLGNTSLAGAIKFAKGNLSLEDLEAIKKKCKVVELAGRPEFQEKYIEEMNFNG